MLRERGDASDLSRFYDPQPAASADWRQRCFDIIFGYETRAGRGFDVALVIVILVSVGIVLADSVAALSQRFGAQFMMVAAGALLACVLVLSRGLQNAGAVDALTRTLLPANTGRLLSLAALLGLGALLSNFMNTVGAMALLMPVAIHVSQRLELTPGQVLMPLAFGTILAA